MTESSGASLRVDLDGAVAFLTLNRPDVLNAINLDMANRLREATGRLAEDSCVKVVVIHGEGRAFMGGGDLKEIAAARSGTLADPWSAIGPLIENFHAAVLNLRRMPKPVLASVHGAVAGGGFSLALASDLMVAAAGSRFVAAYDRLGTTPDGGCTHALCRALGTRKAAQLLLHGDAVDAAEAQRLGLVNWVVADTELAGATARIAGRLADASATAAAAVKALLADAPTRGLAEQLDAELASFRRCAATEDFAEGLAAFLERRAPRFGRTAP